MNVVAAAIETTSAEVDTIAAATTKIIGLNAHAPAGGATGSQHPAACRAGVHTPRHTRQILGLLWPCGGGRRAFLAAAPPATTGTPLMPKPRPRVSAGGGRMLLCRLTGLQRCQRDSAWRRCSLPAAGMEAGARGVDAYTVAQLAEQAQVWCAQHGLVVAAAEAATFTHAPLSLLPTPFPRAAFEQAQQLAAPFALLCAAVARDAAFLRSTLAGACQSDPFTARLFAVFDEAAAQPHAATVELALLRSDYMVDEPTGALQQVEINTVAASFGCLSTLTGARCRHAVRHSLSVRQAGCTRTLCPGPGLRRCARRRLCRLTALSRGWRRGWRRRGARPAAPASSSSWCSRASATCSTSSGCRRRCGASTACARCAARWRRSTLRAASTRLAGCTSAPTPSPSSISAQGAKPRTCGHARNSRLAASYTPDDYPSEAEWRARRLMECSVAVKCPSISWHLAGAKKVQQELAQPVRLTPPLPAHPHASRQGVLERFLPADSALRVRACFAGLWALDGADAEAVVAMALADPDGFVLKPQREGGGNNLYGAELEARLRAGREGLGAFILMRRIRPPLNAALFMRLGAVTSAAALGELGVYSVFVSRGGELLANRAVGHLLRTKVASSNEGGVAAGFAVLDSPLLV